jgi:hypothetical protein
VNNRHDFKIREKVKYLGNKGVVTFVSPNTVVVELTGPFMRGSHTFIVNSPEFKQLKKA